MTRALLQQAESVLAALTEVTCVYHGDGTATVIACDIPREAKATITAIRKYLEQPAPRNQCGETCERARLCAACSVLIGEV
jgi:hypothetical protein